MQQANKVLCYFWSIMNITRICIAAFLIGCTHPLFAQKKIWVGPASKIFNFQFNYTHISPGGDFSTRFGNFHGIGGGGLLKTTHNILLGVEGNYNFGPNVKESNVLYNLTNNVGQISTNAGNPGSVNLSMRGFNVMGKAGYLIPVSSRNRNSGIAIMVGGGIVQHKINIAVQNDNIPGLTNEKRKGYDRYSSGWAATQFIGYYHQSINKLYNFYLGFDVVEAVTYNRRKYNYDQMQYDTGRHNDYYLGIRLGWMIPVYINTKTSDDEYIFK
jgi:hypothetical protein